MSVTWVRGRGRGRVRVRVRVRVRGRVRVEHLLVFGCNYIGLGLNSVL